MTDSNALQKSGVLSLEIAEPFEALSLNVEKWLKDRGRFEQTVRPAADSQKIYFLTRWVRDSSLRYYLLNYDTRNPHLTEWKSQWTVTSLGPHRSQLDIKVLEVIFMGPPSNAGPLPEINARKERSLLVSEWFESTPDYLRASIEARRFWNEMYPLKALPRKLGNISVSSFSGAPLSKEQLRRQWEPLRRDKSF